MTRWNVLKFRQLLARTSWSLTLPSSINFSIVTPPGAPVDLVIYRLQCPTKYGVTHIKEFVTFLSSYSLVDLHQSPVQSNQPLSNAQGMVPTSSLLPLAHGIPSHTFFPPPTLQGTLGNPRFKAN